MNWLQAAADLAAKGKPFVLVTVAGVRGHAPRGPGSKMLVTREGSHGSIGGGNLEETALERARALLHSATDQAELFSVILNPQGGEHGLQCCGGEVTVLLEPVSSDRPTIAIFGAGHVGWALVGVLGSLPVALQLLDSRAAQLERQLPAPLAADLQLRHAPVPEAALDALPAGTHLLILTHDHAEDLAILERALRRSDWGFLGLIGSRTKWSHFRGKLLEEGLGEDDLARVTTPLGLPGVPGKSPQAIAISTAAQLLAYLNLPETNF
ncbi:MAG TPA: xanthine dehydrogenase accessory protein XdhC [Trueperaceae bacterium]